MRKLLLLLCFLVFSQQNFSQEVDFNRQKASLTMDNTVIPIVEEFTQEGQERGFYLRFYLMERVDNIVFLKDFGTGTDPRLGTISADYRSIYLSPELQEQPLLLKVTVFHEIGHIIRFSGEHTCFNCYDIMSEYAPETLEPYQNETFWEYKLDDYFDWLNGKQ